MWNVFLQVTAHHIHSASDDEVDFKDGGFHPDSSLQQVGTQDLQKQTQMLTTRAHWHEDIAC